MCTQRALHKLGMLPPLKNKNRRRGSRSRRGQRGTHLFVGRPRCSISGAVSTHQRDAARHAGGEGEGDASPKKSIISRRLGGRAGARARERAQESTREIFLAMTEVYTYGRDFHTWAPAGASAICARSPPSNYISLCLSTTHLSTRTRCVPPPFVRYLLARNGYAAASGWPTPSRFLRVARTRL